MKHLSILLFMSLVYISHATTKSDDGMLDDLLNELDSDKTIKTREVELPGQKQGIQKFPWAGKDSVSKKRELLTKIKDLLEESIKDDEKTNEKDEEAVTLTDLLDAPLDEAENSKPERKSADEAPNALPWKRNVSDNENIKKRYKEAIYRRIINDLNELFTVTDE